MSDENSDQLREDILNKLFWKVIQKTRHVLKHQLDEFRATRAAGLGNIFGPADPELKLCDENLEKRMTVINERLVPMLETMAEDLENATDMPWHQGRGSACPPSQEFSRTSSLSLTSYP